MKGNKEHKIIKFFLINVILIFVFGCASPRKMSDVIQHPEDYKLSKETLSLEIKKYETFERILSDINCITALQNKIDCVNPRKSMDGVELQVYFPCHPVKRIANIEELTCFVKQRREHLVNLYQKRESKN